MSYGHAADGRLAPALQEGLQRFAKPWYRLRALEIFRDQTDLGVNPALWSTIRAALDVSDHFILLASPRAAASPWVQREAAHWLEGHARERCLLALTEGELVWDGTRGAFDPARTMALPPALLDAFAEEPLFLDLRWAREEAHLSLAHPRFREAVAELAAPLHGMPKDALIGEDVRQHRRTRRLARSAVAGLSALTVLAVAASVIAWREQRAAEAARVVADQQRGIAQAQTRLAVEQRRVAEAQTAVALEQRQIADDARRIAEGERRVAEIERAAAVRQGRIALARQLAAQSVAIRTQYPERLPLAALLAIASTDLHSSFDGNEALRDALALLPRPVRGYPYTGPDSMRGRVRALAFSPDGRTLAAGRDDGTVAVLGVEAHKPIGAIAHDARAGGCVTTLGSGFACKAAGVDAEVTAIAFDPGGAGGTAILWDARSGQRLRRVLHGEEVRPAAFSPDGTLLACLSTDGEVSLSDAAAGGERGRWQSGESGLALAFSADGAHFVTASGNTATVWRVADAHRVLQVTHERSAVKAVGPAVWIDGVAFSRDGAFVDTAGRDGTARVWVVATGEELVRVVHGAPVHAVAFGPDGTSLATSAADQTARLWELPSGRERLRAAHDAPVEVAAFSPAGDLAASADMAGNTLIWRLAPGDRIAEVWHGREVAAVAFRPDGGAVAKVDRAGSLLLWSREGRLLAWSEAAGFHPTALAFSGDGRSVAVTSANPRLWIARVSNLLIPALSLTSREVQDPEIRSTFAAARSADHRQVRVWRTGDAAPVIALDVDRPDDFVMDARGTARATRVKIGNRAADGSEIRVWRIADGAPLGRFRLDTQVGAWDLGPEGRSFAVVASEPGARGAGSRDHLDIWDVGAGVRRLHLPLAGEMRAVAFHPGAGARVGRRARPLGPGCRDRKAAGTPVARRGRGRGRGQGPLRPRCRCARDAERRQCERLGRRRRRVVEPHCGRGLGAGCPVQPGRSPPAGRRPRRVGRPVAVAHRRPACRGVPAPDAEFQRGRAPALPGRMCPHVRRAPARNPRLRCAAADVFVQRPGGAIGLAQRAVATTGAST